VIGIDESRERVALRVAILTVSDTRTEADDRSGQTLVERAEAAGHRVVRRQIVRDDRAGIEAALRALVEDPEVQVVIATGGTGITGRDVTPEAFHALYDTEIPGFGERFRWISFQ
jgi:molybdenum cofactor biosynthesis protein B